MRRLGSPCYTNEAAQWANVIIDQDGRVKILRLPFSGATARYEAMRREWWIRALFFGSETL